MFELLKDYPQAGLLVIAAFFSSIGFLAQSFISFLLERNKKNKEIKEIYWKEKIQSAKKATEYYLQHMSFIKLSADMYGLLGDSKPESHEYLKKIDELIEILRLKLLEFPHYEHHHINLFYDFDVTGVEKIIQENYNYSLKIAEIKFHKNDTLEEINLKLAVISANFKKLKGNNIKTYEIYKQLLKTIREDLKSFVE